MRILRRLKWVAAALAVGLASVGTRPAGANETGGPERCVGSGNSVADAYNAAFGSPIGFWQAGDVPQWYPLPDGRVLWILNDSYLNRKAPAGRITADSVLVRNVAVMQTGTCFEVIAGIKPPDPVDPAAPPPDPALPLPDPVPESFFAAFETKNVSWWWAHGGVVDGDYIRIFFTFMRQTGPVGWEINFAPFNTAIVTYRWRTMEFVDAVAAPNAGVRPVYGFSIAHDASWTYLFGAGVDLRFNAATKTNFVARVPKNRVFDRPSYWNGSGWVSDPAAAVSISTQGSWTHRMRVVHDDDRWVAIAKEDEFFGDELLVMEAPEPQGPWTITQRIPVAPRSTTGGGVTYESGAFPRFINGKLLVSWSNNDYDYAPVAANPSLYRPRFGMVELGPPTRSNAICHGQTPGGIGPVAGTTTARYVPVAPSRIYDSRTTGTKIAANETVTINAADLLGVPKQSIAAVTLNVTIDATSGPGFGTVWPTGTALPTASNLNADRAGMAAPNLVTVPVDSAGRISVFVTMGTNLIVDAFGWYERVATARAGRFVAVSPDRVIDTRHLGGPRPAGTTTVVPMAGRNGLPASGISAVIVNLTATDVRATGFVTAWGEGAVPASSNLNVELGSTRANQAIVPLGTDGSIRLANNVPMHLIVDVVGYVTDDTAPSSTKGLFVPIQPRRLMDSRFAAGVPGSGCVATLPVLGGMSAAVTNVTLTGTTRTGFATTWPGTGAMPVVSTLNIDRVGQTRPNHAVVPLAADGTFKTYLGPRTHLIVDLVGYFT